RLMTHRYAMRGSVDEEGYPVQAMGVLEPPVPAAAPKMKGMRCPECSNYAVIRKDGCDFCSACGWVGVCGQSQGYPPGAQFSRLSKALRALFVSLSSCAPME